MIRIKQSDVSEFAIYDGDEIVATLSYDIDEDVLTVGEVNIISQIEGLDMADALLRAVASYAREKASVVMMEDGKEKSIDEVLAKQCKH